jgi:hypothetical protein
MSGRARSRRTYRVRANNEFPDLGFEEVYGDMDAAETDTEAGCRDPDETGRDADVAHAEPGSRSILSRRGAGVVAVAVVAMAISALVVHAVRSQLSGGAGGLPAADSPPTISRPPASALAPPATRSGQTRERAGTAVARDDAGVTSRSGIARAVRAKNARAGGSALTNVVAKGTAATAVTTTETKTVTPSEATATAPTATAAVTASAGGDHGATASPSAIPEFGFER